jgi:hypothetical protein
MKLDDGARSAEFYTFLTLLHDPLTSLRNDGLRASIGESDKISR